MNDKPDKIDFIQRRVWLNYHEIIPRRRDDRRVFEQLTGRQEDAYNRIDEAYGYIMAGLPVARMKYTDAPGGYDYELTPNQLDVVADYREWAKIMVSKKLEPCFYVILAYMTGATTPEIEARLRVGRGKAANYIYIGLAEYCRMKRWPVDVRQHSIRITGYAAELDNFVADGFDDLGRPERSFAAKGQKMNQDGR